MAVELTASESALVFYRVRDVLEHHTSLAVQTNPAHLHIESNYILPYKLPLSDRQDLVVATERAAIKELYEVLPDKLFRAVPFEIKIANDDDWQGTMQRAIDTCCDELVEPIVRGQHIWSHWMMDADDSMADLNAMLEHGLKVAVAEVYFNIRFVDDVTFNYGFGWQGRLVKKVPGPTNVFEPLELQQPSWGNNP